MDFLMAPDDIHNMYHCYSQNHLADKCQCKVGCLQNISLLLGLCNLIILDWYCRNHCFKVITDYIVEYHSTLINESSLMSHYWWVKMTIPTVYQRTTANRLIIESDISSTDIHKIKTPFAIFIIRIISFRNWFGKSWIVINCFKVRIRTC